MCWWWVFSIMNCTRDNLKVCINELMDIYRRLIASTCVGIDFYWIINPFLYDNWPLFLYKCYLYESIFTMKVISLFWLNLALIVYLSEASSVSSKRDVVGVNSDGMYTGIYFCYTRNNNRRCFVGLNLCEDMVFFLCCYLGKIFNLCLNNFYLIYPQVSDVKCYSYYMQEYYTSYSFF